MIPPQSPDVPVVPALPVPAERRRPSRRPPVTLAARFATVVVACLAAVVVLHFHSPPKGLRARPFDAIFAAVPAPDAYGVSGELRVRFAMPGEAVSFPIALQGDPSRLTYRWVRAVDAAVVDSARPLAGGAMQAPGEPGFYRLAVEHEGRRHVVPQVTLAVMVPFEAKEAGNIDGYRIGTYLAERVGIARTGRPDGFVKVDASTAALPLSKHFTVGDFLSHDGQRQWPRFAAVHPRLIDKLELVIEDVARARGLHPDSVRVRVTVNAGYRSPSHNRTVARAARDSRHQYGDAADVAIDADFDGRFSRADSRLVAAAVERVETAHPDLAGGMGLYLSGRYTHGYVHIDARGRKARWRG